MLKTSLRLAFAPESAIRLSQITPADIRHLQTPDGVLGTHRCQPVQHPPPIRTRRAATEDQRTRGPYSSLGPF